jgi:hypothetical protein
MLRLIAVIVLAVAAPTVAEARGGHGGPLSLYSPFSPQRQQQPYSGWKPYGDASPRRSFNAPRYDRW